MGFRAFEKTPSLDGSIGIHAASATEDEWPFYRQLVVISRHATNDERTLVK